MLFSPSLWRTPQFRNSISWIPAIAPIPNPSPFTGEGGVEQFAAANWMLKLGRNDELVAGLLADSLISDQDAKAFAAAHAVYGKIPLVDGGNCRDARAFCEGDEGGIGVVARQIRILGNDIGERGVIGDGLDPQQFHRAGAPEPDERRPLMSRTCG